MTDSRTPGHQGGVLAATAEAVPVPTDATAPSFGAVYEAHFDFVWRVARRLGVDEGAVDDVVQDVFVVVHRRLEDFEGRSALRTWLYGIARRVVSDHRRKERRRREAPMDESPALEAVGPGPEERAQQQEAAALLHALLDGLPDEQREVFVLAELEQLSAPEIVELTGAKLNTVYSRLRLARRAFEQALTRRRRSMGENE